MVYHNQACITHATKLRKALLIDPCELFRMFPKICKDEIFGSNVSEEISWSLRHFELRKKLGPGTSGSIYFAQERKNKNNTIALKVIPNGEEEDDVLAVISIQAILQHEHILTVYSFFYDEENIYLIMQHIPQSNLCHFYPPGECVPEQQAARHMANLVDAMMYYSREGIVHRD